MDRSGINLRDCLDFLFFPFLSQILFPYPFSLLSTTTLSYSEVNSPSELKQVENDNISESSEMSATTSAVTQEQWLPPSVKSKCPSYNSSFVPGSSPGSSPHHVSHSPSSSASGFTTS